MSTGDLLSIEPQELQFPFELRKKISCSLRLSNKTDNYVAFKVITTNPKNHCVKPNRGIVLPRSTYDVIDIKLAEFVGVGYQFNEELGRNVEKCKMRVVYVAPPWPPSRAREGSSLRASISDSRNLNILGFTAVSA